jgi:hypothetical protein
MSDPAFFQPSSNPGPETSPFSLLSRRKAAGILGAAGAAIIGGGSPASAFLFRKAANPEVNLSTLPEQWVSLQGRNLPNYIDYLSSLNLENIEVEQVVSAHAKQKGNCWNTIAPQNMWRNIGGTLKVIDRLAREINMPVKEVVSVYRSPAYNARCPGAKSSSWHQVNCAVDVVFPARASAITRTIRDLRNRGLFRGGVGGYSGFTHIDTRGQNVDW